MNIKKNYNKGARRELTYIILSTGLITHDSLHILSPERNYNSYRIKLEEMVREKVVEKRKYKRGNDQISFYTFADFTKFANIIKDSVPAASIDYYKDEREVIQRISRENNSRALRKIQEAEIMLFMYMAGFSALADQTEGTRYYNSKEIKRYLNYNDDVESKTDTVLYTKVHGFVSNEYNNYAVYRTTKSLPALSSGETKIINIYKMFIKQVYPDTKKVELRSILFTKTLAVLHDYIDITDTRIGMTHDLAISSYLDKYQKGTYALPYDDNGKKHIRVMATPEWDKRTIELYLDRIPDTTGSNIACDDYDKEEQVYTLVFCVPNLNKLKNFYYNAKLINKPESFRVLCFDYQYDFINSLFEEYAEIYEANFEKYYEGIIGDFN